MLTVQAEIQHVRFTILKAAAGWLLTHRFVGYWLGILFANKIPVRGGLTIDTTFGASNWVKAALFWGLYESAEMRFIRRFLRPNRNVVELGSSLGVVSCLIARTIGPDSRLLCIEANPNLTTVIANNVALNVPLSQITVVNAAIHYSRDGTGLVQFQIAEDNLTSSITSGPENGATVTVKSTTLSSLLTNHSIDDYVLVADIEGAELGIFLNDREALRHCRQIIAELHSTSSDGVNYSVEDLVRILTEECGYLLLARRGPVCVFERAEYR